MTAQGKSYEVLERIAATRMEHPHAIPITPGTWDVWQVKVGDADPLGYVRRHRRPSADRKYVFDTYAWCRDELGGRPWLMTHQSLNSAVAWMTQHASDIRDLIARSSPEPQPWPPQLYEVAGQPQASPAARQS